MTDRAAMRDERAAVAVALTGDGATVSARKGTFHAIIHHREFRLLWTAGVVTQFGQWFQNIAIGWLALTHRHSAARLLAERQVLVSALERAKEDYLVATRGSSF